MCAVTPRRWLTSHRSLRFVWNLHLYFTEDVLKTILVSKSYSYRVLSLSSQSFTLGSRMSYDVTAALAIILRGSYTYAVALREHSVRKELVAARIISIHLEMKLYICWKSLNISCWRSNSLTRGFHSPLKHQAFNISTYILPSLLLLV